jgi:hypothetical protein
MQNPFKAHYALQQQAMIIAVAFFNNGLFQQWAARVKCMSHEGAIKSALKKGTKSKYGKSKQLVQTAADGSHQERDCIICKAHKLEKNVFLTLVSTCNCMMYYVQKINQLKIAP